MDYLLNHLQCSPYFPANPESFTFDANTLTIKQVKRNTTPSLSSSPLCLNKQISTETSKDNQSNFTLQSPGGESNIISFKEAKMSPSTHQPTDSCHSPPFDLNNTNSSENASSSRNNNNALSIQLIDMKENTFSLPKSKYSSKYQSDQTIKEDPNEDSFNHRRKSNRRCNKESENNNSILNKESSSNESKRMIIEMLKIIGINDEFIEKNQIDINTFVPYHFLRANVGVANKNMQTVKMNELATCSTKDNEEEVDESTKLICFLSIPRIVYLYHSKQLICISPCSSGSSQNEEVYSILFKHFETMKLIEVISFKSITGCYKKTDMVFCLQFIQTRTFLKKLYNIETQSKEDCEKYVTGIKGLIQKYI